MTAPDAEGPRVHPMHPEWCMRNCGCIKAAGHEGKCDLTGPLPRAGCRCLSCEPVSAGSGASPARDGDTRLAEIAARVAAATPGPWFVEPEQASDTSYTPARVTASVSADYWSGDCDEMQLAAGAPGDAEFIAAVRSDVPWLLVEVERLRAERDAAREFHTVEYHQRRTAESERDAAVAALNRVRAAWDEHWKDGSSNWHSGCSGCLNFKRQLAADVPDAAAAGETG